MRYGSVARRSFMIRHNLHKTGLVQTHHVIPKQFRAHPLIARTRYDVNESANLMLMPTPLGKRLMPNVRRDRLTHGWGHKRYDAYVAHMLNCLRTREELDAFRDYLKRAIRRSPYDLPWD